MNIKETRKAQLRRWVAINGTPVAEKSYFSQVVTEDTSFGEKAARRLEEQYHMGAMFLDTPGAPVLQVESHRQRNRSTPLPNRESINPDDLIELISLFSRATEDMRLAILDVARESDEAISDQGISADHQTK